MKRARDRINRRNFLATTAGVCLGGVSRAWAQEADADVRIVLNYDRGLWYYDPVGIYIQPGETVQWTALRWTPTVTAFHPDIGNRELRIPEGAEPFDSGMLATMQTFRWTFEAAGTYDYYSRYHEGAGLVGRVVVGTPGGPAEKPPRYGGSEGRAPIYAKAIRVFDVLDSREIVEKRTVPFPVDQLAYGRFRRRR